MSSSRSGAIFSYTKTNSTRNGRISRCTENQPHEQTKFAHDERVSRRVWSLVTHPCFVGGLSSQSGARGGSRGSSGGVGCTSTRWCQRFRASFRQPFLISLFVVATSEMRRSACFARASERLFFSGRLEKFGFLFGVDARDLRVLALLVGTWHRPDGRPVNAEQLHRLAKSTAQKTKAPGPIWSADNPGAMEDYAYER